jgi:hypothetical protein
MSNPSVFEFGGERGQHVRRHADVAVGHHHQIVAGGFQHEVQAVHFGVRVGGLTGHNQLRRHSRITRLQAFYNPDGPVGGASYGKQDLKLGVALLEEGPQVFLQPFFGARQRFEDADRRRRARFRRAHTTITNRGDNCKYLINQGAGHKGQQRYDKHFTLLYTVTVL